MWVHIGVCVCGCEFAFSTGLQNKAVKTLDQGAIRQFVHYLYQHFSVHDDMKLPYLSFFSQ